MATEALILAAGTGSRFGSVTAHQPKALIELNDEPLLFRMIRQCRAAGVQQVNIVVGHFASTVGERVADEFGPEGFSFIANDQFETTNNIVSLAIGLDHLHQQSIFPDVLVLECDVILADNVLPRVIASESANVAVVSPYVAGLDGTVVRLSGDRVTEFIPTDRQGVDFDYSGTFKTVNVYKFSPEFWSHKLRKLLHWYVDAIDSGGYYENAIGLVSYAGPKDLTALTLPSDSWHEVDDSNDLRRAHVKFTRRPRYGPLTSSHGGWWDFEVTDFYYLRNMHFPPPAMVAQLRGSFVSALQNYGSEQSVLDLKVSWFLGTAHENTLFLSGLSSIYPLMAGEFDNPGTLVPSPSFGEYAARFPRATSYDPHTSLADLRALIETTGARRVIVVNPNNPSGALHATKDIVTLMGALPAVRFIVDESFLPFTAEQSLTENHEHLARNAVVISSLGKTLGVPGLRLGYAWSKDLEWLDGYRRDLPIWAANSIAEQFISLLPKYKQEYKQSLARTVIDKDEFVRLLAAIPGLTLVPGAHGNFINAMLTNLSADSSLAVCEEFLTAGHLVKCVNEKVTADHPLLRIAVRTDPENRVFAQLLAGVAAG